MTNDRTALGALEIKGDKVAAATILQWEPRVRAGRIFVISRKRAERLALLWSPGDTRATLRVRRDVQPQKQRMPRLRLLGCHCASSSILSVASRLRPLCVLLSIPGSRRIWSRRYPPNIFANLRREYVSRLSVGV